MEDFESISNALFSNNALGLGIAGIIFFITIILLIRKLIGVVVTVILLFFALVSGLAIANNDIVRNYLSNKPADKSTSATSEDWKTQFNHFKEQLLQQWEDFKKEHPKEK